MPASWSLFDPFASFTFCAKPFQFVAGLDLLIIHGQIEMAAELQIDFVILSIELVACLIIQLQVTIKAGVLDNVVKSVLKGCIVDIKQYFLYHIANSDCQCSGYEADIRVC